MIWWSFLALNSDTKRTGSLDYLEEYKRSVSEAGDEGKTVRGNEVRHDTRLEGEEYQYNQW